MRSEAQKRAESKYKRESCEQLALRFRKEFCVKCRLEQAAKSKGLTVIGYITDVLEAQLTADGYPRPPKP